MPQTGFQSGFHGIQWVPGLGKDCANSMKQRQKTNSLNFKKMKSIMFLLVSIVFTVFFTGCNDDFVPQPKDIPAVNSRSVQVKFETTPSPVLKDGDDENNPDPMTFNITGTVMNSSTPVQAEVELVSIPENALIDSTSTDGNGGFVFYQVPAGSYNVVVSVDGSVAEVITVNL